MDLPTLMTPEQIQRVQSLREASLLRLGDVMDTIAVARYIELGGDPFDRVAAVKEDD